MLNSKDVQCVESLDSPSNREGSMAHNAYHSRNTVELCVLCCRVSQIHVSYPIYVRVHLRETVRGIVFNTTQTYDC